MPVKILVLFIKLYQKVISPYLGETCRFHPSCSEYAVLTLKKDGVFKGALKSIWRILKCNPLTKGGIDFP